MILRDGDSFCLVDKHIVIQAGVAQIEEQWVRGKWLFILSEMSFFFEVKYSHKPILPLTVWAEEKKRQREKLFLLLPQDYSYFKAASLIKKQTSFR